MVTSLHAPNTHKQTEATYYTHKQTPPTLLLNTDETLQGYILLSCGGILNFCRLPTDL